MIKRHCELLGCNWKPGPQPLGWLQLEKYREHKIWGSKGLETIMMRKCNAYHIFEGTGTI